MTPARACLALACVATGLGVTASDARAAATIVDGSARFQVITPSLVRMEYAEDGRFEDRPTMTTAGRLQGRPHVTTRVTGGQRIIRTSRLELRWRRGSGPFSEGSLRLKLDGMLLRPEPGPNPAPLGGWRRSLDLVNGPVPLHEGVLSREGWYLLDDTATALATNGGFAPRPDRRGVYQDLYLFAYGRDLVRGLRDLRTLTGPAPMLPRKAFGVWFSRWWPYGDADWRRLADRFRAERVPLDTISLDTDFKRVHDPVGGALGTAVVGAPGGRYSWNGWDWNRELYPDPPAFLRWARRSGLEVGLNVHPSISTSDPEFPETQRRAGGRLRADDGCRIEQADTRGECMVFDWTDPLQLDAYFRLHERFERDGPSFWWLDWCCDGSGAEAPGLTPDTWINKLYFERQRARGSRWPAFSRIGGSHQMGFDGNAGTGAFAEHRYTLHFTGDTCATWPLLRFAAEFTAAEGSIGMPYVSHDIGTFHSVSPVGDCDGNSTYHTAYTNDLPADMYVRWVQLGTFQPIARLHSHHGRRLPWEYHGPAGAAAAAFLRLRGALVPYLYSLAREAHDEGLPMARAMYLQWPGRAEAYEHPSQYTLGRDLLVAPVAAPGDDAEVTVWFPPGTWIDWFTGERHRGPAVRKLSVPLDRMPVFARAGAVVPLQPYAHTTPRRPSRSLALRAHRGNGRFTLYDDAGEGLEHEHGAFSRTPIRQRRAGRATVLTIGPARGRFAGQRRRRSYRIRLIGVRRPRTVTIAGRRAHRWDYSPDTRTALIRTGRLPVRRSARIAVR